MKKRQLKKWNKKKIEKILDVIKHSGYTIIRPRFGSGYFVFSFEANSVCWFQLKEIPDWKFGIWITASKYIRNNQEKKFSIFGENIYCIDKFKPSASTLSETNLSDFLRELAIIHNLIIEPDVKVIGKLEEQSFIDWREYLIEAEEAKQTELEQERYNQLIFETLVKKGNEFGHPFKVVTKDRNLYGKCSISPRYETNILFDNEVDMSDDEYLKHGIEIYKQLCLSLEDLNIPDEVYLESVIFNDISTMVMSPSRYKSEETRWNRHGDFDKHLEELWDYYRDHELTDEKILEITEAWDKSNYPDTPTTAGFLEAFSRVHEGKYSIQRATHIINRYFRNKEKK